MIDALTHVNWIAVALASLAQFVLGGVWFGAVVARPYAAALGLADRPPQKPGALALAGPFVCGALTAATTAVLFAALRIATLGDALALGALVGLGYLVPTTVTIAINPLFPRPFAYALVNAPYFVAGSLMTGALLAAMA